MCRGSTIEQRKLILHMFSTSLADIYLPLKGTSSFARYLSLILKGIKIAQRTIQLYTSFELP